MMKPIKAAIIGGVTLASIVGGTMLWSGGTYRLPEVTHAIVRHAGTPKYIDVNYPIGTPEEDIRANLAELQAKYDANPSLDVKVRTGAGFRTKSLIQSVQTIDAGVRTWHSAPNHLRTGDTKQIYVVGAMRWRVADPWTFATAAYNEQGAHSRIDDLVDPAVKNAISSFNLVDLIRTNNRELEYLTSGTEGFTESGVYERAFQVQDVTGRGRLDIEKSIYDRVEHILLKEFGIEMIDFQFTVIAYDPSVEENVIEAMVRERERVASGIRSQGDARAAEIDGEREKELANIRSTADMAALRIRGEGLADSMRIKAEGYGMAPSVYGLLKDFEIASNNLDDRLTLVQQFGLNSFRELFSGAISDGYWQQVLAEVEGLDPDAIREFRQELLPADEEIEQLLELAPVLEAPFDQ
jgi:modulator of FtsH protease HflC